jgi:hypothetical protein
MDAAADALRADRDLLQSTHADTYVTSDWIARVVAHVDAGNDTVAGRAFTFGQDRVALGRTERDGLNQLDRYHTALDYLRATAEANAPDH